MYLPLFLILAYTFTGSWVATPAEGARILAVETIGGKSHWNFMSAILRALVDNGHNVTVFTPFLDGNRENYTEFDTFLGSDKIIEEPLNKLMDKFGGPIRLVGKMSTMSRMLCNVVYENSKMKEIFANTHSDDFDIVIIEPLLSECVSYLAIKLNLPLIYVRPIQTVGILARHFTGDMSNPAVISINNANFGIPKTFAQRAINCAYFIYCTAILKINELRDQLTEPQEYDLHTPIPPSLIFINRHFTIEPANPISSNVIDVGGIHLKAPKKLPKVRTMIKNC